MKRTWKQWSGIALALMFLVGCGSSPQPRALEANKRAPVPTAEGDSFRERRQIILRDELSNRDDFLIFAYRLNNDGAVILQWTCQGLPVSSTESVEPNEVEGEYNGVGPSIGHGIPLDDSVDPLYSREMMGLDGTYGEPAPFLYCISPSGHLHHWNFNADVHISSIPVVFGSSAQTFDEVQYAKKLRAEQTIRSGGCIDDFLNPIDCSVVQDNLRSQMFQPSPEMPALDATTTPLTDTLEGEDK